MSNTEQNGNRQRNTIILDVKHETQSKNGRVLECNSRSKPHYLKPVKVYNKAEYNNCMVCEDEEDTILHITSGSPVLNKKVCIATCMTGLHTLENVPTL